MQSRSIVQLSIPVLLGAALALGYGANDDRSADSIGITQLPTAAGAWVCSHQEVLSSTGSESRRVLRTYRRSDGCRIEVTLEATWTRLGALRDWTVARSAQGWVAQPQQARKLHTAGPPPFTFTASLRNMQKGSDRIDTLMWFTTTDADAANLVQAEVSAWRGRLLGRAQPWCEMYLTTARKNTEDDIARTALEELGCELAPQLRQLMSDAVSVG
jgi:hypothetical protein